VGSEMCIRDSGASAADHWRTAKEARRSAQGDWCMGTRAIGARIRRDSCYPRRHKNSGRETLYGLGNDAGELNGYASTHLTNKCYDRLVVARVAKWVGLEVPEPPFGRKPNDTNKRVWTNNYYVGAVLRTD
jgi:hypothetical protein